MDNTAQLNKQILKASKEGQVFIKNEKGNLVPVSIGDLVAGNKELEIIKKFLSEEYLGFDLEGTKVKD
jgi:hypothetical protein